MHLNIQDYSKRYADSQALLYLHSNLVAPKMILVASQSKPFLYTSKGTTRRQVCIAEYDAEIRAAYDAVAESSQSHIEPPTIWDMEGTTDFVRDVVIHVMGDTGGKVNDDAELFQVGLDR